MPDCDYCERSFDSEGDYLDHLADSHDGELGRIDRRRVDSHTSPDGIDVPPMAIYAVAGVALLAVAGAGLYYVVDVFSADPTEPIHEHGTITVEVEGEQVNLGSAEFQRSQAFHFHPGDPAWHMEPREPRRLTLSEAMAELGVELTANSITIRGETYRDDDPETTLTVEVDGESVDPETYELHGVSEQQPPSEGDSIRIVAETSA